MENLPLELQERVLLPLSPWELFSVCQSNSYYRSICSDARFWRQKFEEEGLPLLERGSDAQSWLKIYNRSFQANKRVEEYPKGEQLGLIEVDITPANIDLVSTAKISPAQIQENFYSRIEESQSNRAVSPDNDITEEILRQYAPRLYKLDIFSDLGRIVYRLRFKFLEEELFHSDYLISKEDLNYLLYKLFYYGLIR